MEGLDAHCRRGTRLIGLGVVLALLLAPLGARAQQTTGPARVGYLGNTRPEGPHPLVEGLRALGWVEGRNVIIEWRYTEGNIERAPELAAELVRLKPDVIVASAPPVVRAVQQATSSIPIVMTAVSDPVGMGFVASLARPGGNITGVTSAIPEGFMGKTLQLIKETIPKASRVGLLFNPANPLNYATARARELAAASQTLKIQLQHLEIRSADDIEKTLTAANLEGLQAVCVVGDPLTFRHRRRIHELAARHKVPTFVPTPEYVEGLALLSYGPSLKEMTRQTAVYVDKILKGAKAADLPVEQPTRYQLLINLKTAKALGLTIPQTLLLRADQVIE
jgi:putative tryptophan/tyrosine transport system substrate-binding protein